MRIRWWACLLSRSRRHVAAPQVGGGPNRLIPSLEACCVLVSRAAFDACACPLRRNQDSLNEHNGDPFFRACFLPHPSCERLPSGVAWAIGGSCQGCGQTACAQSVLQSRCLGANNAPVRCRHMYRRPTLHARGRQHNASLACKPDLMHAVLPLPRETFPRARVARGHRPIVDSPHPVAHFPAILVLPRLQAQAAATRMSCACRAPPWVRWRAPSRRPYPRPTVPRSL
jgi:hypothetical protein